jgi:hypothetical protein
MAVFQTVRVGSNPTLRSILEENMFETHLAPDLVAMSSNMTTPQSIVLFTTSVFGMFGLVADYKTTVDAGGVEGNPFTLKLMKLLHVSLPVLTFVMAAAMLVIVAMMAVNIGGWWPNIPPVLIGVFHGIQALKNRKLKK